LGIRPQKKGQNHHVLSIEEGGREKGETELFLITRHIATGKGEFLALLRGEKEGGRGELPYCQCGAKEGGGVTLTRGRVSLNLGPGGRRKFIWDQGALFWKKGKGKKKYFSNSCAGGKEILAEEGPTQLRTGEKGGEKRMTHST